jgi:hypothetical protein
MGTWMIHKLTNIPELWSLPGKSEPLHTGLNYHNKGWYFRIPFLFTVRKTYGHPVWIAWAFKRYGRSHWNHGWPRWA